MVPVAVRNVHQGVCVRAPQGGWVGESDGGKYIPMDIDIYVSEHAYTICAHLHEVLGIIAHLCQSGERYDVEVGVGVRERVGIDSRRDVYVGDLGGVSLKSP